MGTIHLRGTAKDHKTAKDPKIGPEQRPIMWANVGPNTGLSQIGCKLLRSIIDDIEVRHDVKSTEEMLESFVSYNKSLKSKKSQGKRIYTSMDIKSFYPSIDPTRGAKIARCMWNRSKLEVPNLNVDELIEYVLQFGLIESIEDENLKDFLYLKKKKKKSFVKRKRVAKKFKNKGFKAAQGLATLA